MTPHIHLLTLAGNRSSIIRKRQFSIIDARCLLSPVCKRGKRRLPPTVCVAQRRIARAHPIYTWLIGCASVKKIFNYFEREAVA